MLLRIEQRAYRQLLRFVIARHRLRLTAAQLATLLEGLPWHRLQPRAIPRPSTAW
jgi:hypothetical protein